MKCACPPLYSLILAIVAFLTLSGCQSDTPVKETTILHANLFVRYIYPDQEYKAEVVFKEGDTLATAQPIPAPGDVRFLERILPANQLSDDLTRYDLRFRSAFQSEMPFVLPNLNGQNVPFTLQLDAVAQLNISPIISRETSFLFSCTPADLQQDEMLILLFNDVDNRAASITIDGPADLSQLQLSGSELSQLAPGTGSVYAVKKKDGEQEVNGIITHWSIEYYSDERPVQIQ